jgi:hypothetical protein
MDAEIGDSLPPVTRYWDAGAAFNCEFEYAPAKGTFDKNRRFAPITLEK